MDSVAHRISLALILRTPTRDAGRSNLAASTAPVVLVANNSTQYFYLHRAPGLSLQSFVQQASLLHASSDPQSHSSSPSRIPFPQTPPVTTFIDPGSEIRGATDFTSEALSKHGQLSAHVFHGAFRESPETHAAALRAHQVSSLAVADAVTRAARAVSSSVTVQALICRAVVHPSKVMCNFVGNSSKLIRDENRNRSPRNRGVVGFKGFCLAHLV